MTNTRERISNLLRAVADEISGARMKRKTFRDIERKGRRRKKIKRFLSVTPVHRKGKRWIAHATFLDKRTRKKGTQMVSFETRPKIRVAGGKLQVKVKSVSRFQLKHFFHREIEYPRHPYRQRERR